LATRSIAANVNGKRMTADVKPRLLLAYFLREQTVLTGTHIARDAWQHAASLVQLGSMGAARC
jgi:aerobic-type carbon monoxide dehydrogenase small subunit (CoxS/CutS family)